MRASEIEDCESCPLLGNHCSGGVTGSPNGYIEPPCTSWNPDDEISEEDMDNEQCRYEQLLEKQWEEEEKNKLAKIEKQKRARESRLYVHIEISQIKRLKKRYKALSKLHSIASAFSITNEIMREPKDKNVEYGKTNAELEMDEILLKIESIKAIKKQKLKELRIKRKAVK